MAFYEYLVLDSKGKKIKGKIEAFSADEVLNKLHSEGFHVIDIYELKSKKIYKIKTNELVIFSRQLSALISAGIPIVKSLDILSEQVQNKNFKDVIISIKNSIEAGSSLADAFSKYPEIFPVLFINMINVGEFSGNLDTVLEILTDYLEDYNNLTKKTTSAMVYPIGIIIFASLILIALFIFVIPAFQKMFEGLGAKLPLPTQILINLSIIIKKYFIFLIIGIIGIFLSLNRFKNKPIIMELKEKLISKIPVIGIIFKKIALSRFTKTLAILVKSGIPILNSLNIAAKASNNIALLKKIDFIRDDISKGNKLAESLKKTDFFPSMVIGMIGVGEEGGDLVGMLEKIADIYEEDVDNSISALLSLLEPVIIIFLGIVIGIIVICLFLPILQLTQLIRR